MRRRQFLAGLAAGAAGSVLARMVRAGENLPPLRVVFYSDVHAMPGLSDSAILDRAAGLISKEGADVIIAGGDVIHRGHVSAAADCTEKFDLYLGWLDRLPGGVWHVPGNHDMAGAKPEDGSTPADDPLGMWKARLRVENPCRHFDIRGYRFIILDSLEVLPDDKMLYRGMAGARRLAWLREVLDSTPGSQPIILCTHIPLASRFVDERYPENPPASLMTADARAILEAFHGHRLVAVLQGHVHVSEEMGAGGTPVLTGGAVCGAWWKGSNQGTPPGYARVLIEDRAMSWEYVALG